MDKSVEKAVGERMRAARKRMGMSQRDIADRLNWGLRTYSRFETGEARIPERKLPRLAEVLEVSDMWLLYGDDEKSDIPEDLAALMEGANWLRAAIDGETDSPQWTVSMDSPLLESGLHPAMSASEMQAINERSTSFLNARIDPVIRDELHEFAALSGLSIQSAVRLALTTFLNAVKTGSKNQL